MLSGKAPCVQHGRAAEPSYAQQSCMHHLGLHPSMHNKQLVATSSCKAQLCIDKRPVRSSLLLGQGSREASQFLTQLRQSQTILVVHHFPTLLHFAHHILQRLHSGLQLSSLCREGIRQHLQTCSYTLIPPC